MTYKLSAYELLSVINLLCLRFSHLSHIKAPNKDETCFSTLQNTSAHLWMKYQAICDLCYAVKNSFQMASSSHWSRGLFKHTWYPPISADGRAVYIQLTGVSITCMLIKQCVAYLSG